MEDIWDILYEFDVEINDIKKELLEIREKDYIMSDEELRIEQLEGKLENAEHFRNIVLKYVR